MDKNQKKDMILLILSGIFVANAVIAEMIGGKLIQLGPFSMSIGVIPWPIVFLTTDLVNEFYGKSGVRRITFLTVGLIIYTFIILYLGMAVPAASFSPVTDDAFTQVFGQTRWIIVGSITAFILSQWVDVFTFWLLRNLTGGKLLWLRATGSTTVSQLIDTFVVLGIAFLLPGKITLAQYLSLSVTNYSYKLLIALALTPFIYLGHNLVERFLGVDVAEEMMEEAAIQSQNTLISD